MLEILLQNWAKLIAILFTVIGGIWAILKVYLDYNIKKKEIKFSKLYEHQIIEIKEFYRSYNSLRLKLSEYLHITSQSITDEKNEVRNAVYNEWNRFYLSLITVRLFIDDEQIDLVTRINSEMDDAYKQIDFFNFDKANKMVDKESIKAIRKVRDEILPKNLPKLILELESTFRKKYGSSK